MKSLLLLKKTDNSPKRLSKQSYMWFKIRSIHSTPPYCTSGLQSGAAEPPVKWFWARKKGEVAMSRMG